MEDLTFGLLVLLWAAVAALMLLLLTNRSEKKAARIAKLRALEEDTTKALNADSGYNEEFARKYEEWKYHRHCQVERFKISVVQAHDMAIAQNELIDFYHRL